MTFQGDPYRTLGVAPGASLNEIKLRVPAAREEVPPGRGRRARPAAVPRDPGGLRACWSTARAGCGRRRGRARRPAPTPADPWRADPARARASRDAWRARRSGSGGTAGHRASGAGARAEAGGRRRAGAGGARRRDRHDRRGRRDRARPGDRPGGTGEHHHRRGPAQGHPGLHDLRRGRRDAARPGVGRRRLVRPDRRARTGRSTRASTPIPASTGPSTWPGRAARPPGRQAGRRAGEARGRPGGRCRRPAATRRRPARRRRSRAGGARVRELGVDRRGARRRPTAAMRSGGPAPGRFEASDGGAAWTRGPRGPTARRGRARRRSAAPAAGTRPPARGRRAPLPDLESLVRRAFPEHLLALALRPDRRWRLLLALAGWPPIGWALGDAALARPRAAPELLGGVPGARPGPAARCSSRSSSPACSSSPPAAAVAAFAALAALAVALPVGAVLSVGALAAAGHRARRAGRHRGRRVRRVRCVRRGRRPAVRPAERGRRAGAVDWAPCAATDTRRHLRRRPGVPPRAAGDGLRRAA